MHLVDSKGALIRDPADGPPLNGDWPTSFWVPGETVVDNRLISLPAQLPHGSYSLRLGFYDPVSGTRLVAYRPDGTRWPDDVVIVDGFMIR